MSDVQGYINYFLNDVSGEDRDIHKIFTGNGNKVKRRHSHFEQYHNKQLLDEAEHDIKNY
jgi:hypothetical protein